MTWPHLIWPANLKVHFIHNIENSLGFVVKKETSVCLPVTYVVLILACLKGLAGYPGSRGEQGSRGKKVRKTIHFLIKFMSRV